MKSAFISYGAPDESFARRLDEALNRLGVNTFLFAKHARPGEKLHRLMRDGVNKFDRLILICSKNSLTRSGVLNEIEEILTREAREGGAPIMIPITLDDYVFTDWAPAYQGLAQAIKDRVVADFRGSGTDASKFADAVERLREVLADSGDIQPDADNVSGRSVVTILDVAGHKARQIYERTFIPRATGFVRLMIRDITASGRLEVLSTNIGVVQPPVDEGGKKVVYFNLDYPLEVGCQVTHVVEMLATDCYRDPKEATSFTVTGYYPLIGLEVELPNQRPALSANAWRILDGKRSPCPGLVVTHSNSRLSLTVLEPKMNAIYVIEWTW